MRSSLLVVAVWLAAACAKSSSNGHGGGTAGGSGKPPPPPPADANVGPPVTTRAADAWWTVDPPCPEGATLNGAPRPQSNWVACQDWESKNHGPMTQWWGDGEGRSEGIYEHGLRNGVWVQYHANGAKLEETTYRADKPHGPSMRWWPNGNKRMQGSYVDGRPDGTFTAWKEDGTEIEQFTFALGTGTMKEFHANGRIAWDQTLVDGENHGPAHGWAEDGTLTSESNWVRDQQDGVSTSYTAEGKKWVQGTYRGGARQGRWLFYDKTGEIERAEDFIDDLRVAIIFYEQGTALASVPDPGACKTDEGLKQAAGQAESEHGCVDRAEHFPGIALVGSFAYDRGCMPEGYVVDCALKADVSSENILARAGWSKASGERRQAIALAYVTEIALAMEGWLVRDNPKPPEAVPVIDVASDGTVTFTGWAHDPAGMSRTITSRELTWTFSPTGKVTAKAGRVQDFEP